MKVVASCLISFVFIFLVSCTKGTDCFHLEKHDDNRMMDSIHAVINRIDALPKTNDPEIDFARIMVINLQGSINMSRAQVASGENDSLKRFSQKIITARPLVIQQLNDILGTEIVNNSSPGFTSEQADHLKRMDEMADVQFITGDVDNDFGTLILLHYNNNIDYTEEYLVFGNNSQLKTIAQKIIDDQKKDLREVSDWLKANKR